MTNKQANLSRMKARKRREKVERANQKAAQELDVALAVLKMQMEASRQANEAWADYRKSVIAAPRRTFLDDIKAIFR